LFPFLVSLHPSFILFLPSLLPFFFISSLFLPPSLPSFLFWGWGWNPRYPECCFSPYHWATPPSLPHPVTFPEKKNPGCKSHNYTKYAKEKENPEGNIQK
jgi:hypothetical protein